MSSSRCSTPRLLSIWGPAFLGIAMIALESTALMGAGETSGPLRKFWEALFGRVSEARWENIHHYIRKTGHFTGYGLVSALFFRAWYLTFHCQTRKAQWFRACVCALLCTLIIASTDEYHQSLIPGRTSSPFDVLIDMSGACTTQFVILSIMAIFLPKKTRSAITV